MKKQDKISTVNNLTEQLKEARSVILTDYRGLTVAQMSQLRSQVKKSGGELLVTKNTLLEKALANLDYDPGAQALEGPTAILVTPTEAEETASLKTLYNFAKTNGLPVLKSGVWEGRALSKTELEKLSLLPGKSEMMTKLTGLLASPTGKLVHIITNNPKKLIILLKKIQGGGEIHG